jgi:hypothetical protein
MNKAEGWAFIIGSTKWHYMRDHRSICGKWMVLGNPEVEQGNDASPDNCKACRTKLEKEQAKAQV